MPGATKAPMEVSRNEPGYCICERSDTPTYRPYSRIAFTPSTSLRLEPRHHSPHEQPAKQDERDDPECLPAESGRRIPAGQMAAVDAKRSVEQSGERLVPHQWLQPVR